MNNKDKVEEYLIQLLTEAYNTDTKIYYHYDDNDYNIGDTITRNYDIDNDIVSVYNDIIGIDVTRLVYMLDTPNEDYKYTYKFTYTVKPLDKVLKCQMDYSPLMCKDTIKFANNKGIFKDNFTITDFITYFAKAYEGDEESKDMLQSLIDYDKSNKVEFICTKAQIINKEYED